MGRPPDRDPGPQPGTAPDSFTGECAVCGTEGEFVHDQPSIRESYRCSSCSATLRYQGQAQVLVRRYGDGRARSLADLVPDPSFRSLRVWEPGHLGPLRRYLRDRPHYERSTHRPGAARGARRRGVRNEDLMDLTYPSAAFDLVVTSDVFEHVRRPYVGFAEVHRVLRPGGAHVFSVPTPWPLPDETVARVDTSGAHDVPLLPAVRHSGHLVYHDFGADLLDRLAEIGFDTEIVRFGGGSRLASKVVTFCSHKPRSDDDDESTWGEVERPPRWSAALARLARRGT